MKEINDQKIEEASKDRGRRNFLKTAGLGALGAAGLGYTFAESGTVQERAKVSSRAERLKRMASNSYAVGALFRRRPSQRISQQSNQYKEKYGEITLLDFPGFTRDVYPGVYAMDLWSSHFGDFTDDSMFTTVTRTGRTGPGEFDPSSLSAKRYLDLLVKNMESTGVKATHISNNAPRYLADLDDEQRKEGIRVGKLWLDASRQIGVKSMRVNTGGPQIIPAAVIQGGYPRNEEVVPYIEKAIESFKELADYGEKTGVKVTIENHWGLAANPVNILIILNEVNSPFCEASPDFCNWEHEYMLYHGLEMLVPRAESMVHAKRWTRFPDVDIARCVQVLNDARYKGYISVEYEGGGDPVEGTLNLLNDVVDALI
ncbi:MAG: TIM barrel protein [Bacteroidales bacterium]|nr:TIM barrel protein [Bacteroidales bacterium]